MFPLRCQKFVDQHEWKKRNWPWLWEKNSLVLLACRCLYSSYFMTHIAFKFSRRIAWFIPQYVWLMCFFTLYFCKLVNSQFSNFISFNFHTYDYKNCFPQRFVLELIEAGVRVLIKKGKKRKKVMITYNKIAKNTGFISRVCLIMRFFVLRNCTLITCGN